MAVKGFARRFLAGLATQNQNPIQGGLFGSFQTGLGGALNQGSVDQERALAAAKAQIENDFKMREANARDVSALSDYTTATRDRSSGNVDEINFLMKTLGLPQGDALNRVYPERAGSQPQDWNVPVQGPVQEGQQRPSVPFPGLEGIPPAGREIAFRQMMEKRFGTQPQGRQSPQDKVAGIEKALGRKMSPREKEIATGVFRNPLMESSTHQQVDIYGRPHYVDEQGNNVTQRLGPGNKPRQPWMETTQKIYQQNEGDPLHGLYQQ